MSGAEVAALEYHRASYVEHLDLFVGWRPAKGQQGAGRDNEDLRQGAGIDLERSLYGNAGYSVAKRLINSTVPRQSRKGRLCRVEHLAGERVDGRATAGEGTHRDQGAWALKCIAV